MTWRRYGRRSRSVEVSRSRHKYIAARPLPASNTRRLGPRRWAYHRPVYAHSTLRVFLRRLFLASLLLLAVALVAILAYKFCVDVQTEGLIYSPNDARVPERHVALVFGAGLNRFGGPSAVLYDRVATAADLYRQGKVKKLLMTGDNSSSNYNEVEAMRVTGVSLGVPDGDIVLDYAGFSTWDSCYRAREVFSLNEATLVTQRFHLPRAVHTCKELGVSPVGVIADKQSYNVGYSELREYPAL